MGTEKTYRWAYPSEWLEEKIDNATHEELSKIVAIILTKLDSDTIQDLFQAEMDEDGYFASEPEPEPDIDDGPNYQEIETDAGDRLDPA